MTAPPGVARRPRTLICAPEGLSISIVPRLPETDGYFVVKTNDVCPLAARLIVAVPKFAPVSSRRTTSTETD